MSAIESLCQLLDIDQLCRKKLSKKEHLLLESSLFLFLYHELNKKFENDFNDYLNLIKINFDMEVFVYGSNFMRSLITDIVSTDGYTLSGIAYYANVPEDIIYEIVTGINGNPSLELSRRIMELHKSVRKDLYQNILSKLMRSD